MNDASAKKIIDMETSLGLLQHDFEKQNEVILQNSKQLQQMEMVLRRLTEQVAGMQASGGESQGSLEDEKPPHY